MLGNNRVRAKASLGGRSLRKAQSKNGWHRRITRYQQRKTVMSKLLIGCGSAVVYLVVKR